ncbi:MAG TPA: hypothetical protein VM198_07365 [Longimicrobiales bacterium]|nr:hypothetical protein [Longimicrobiales bacterium]
MDIVRTDLIRILRATRRRPATALGSRVLERFIWGVSVADPVTLAAVLVALPAFAVLAAVGPARRATRVDPLEVLKAE